MVQGETLDICGQVWAADRVQQFPVCLSLRTGRHAPDAAVFLGDVDDGFAVIDHAAFDLGSQTESSHFGNLEFRAYRVLHESAVGTIQEHIGLLVRIAMQADAVRFAELNRVTRNKA